MKDITQITSFSGDYSFLSNFYIHWVEYEGLSYPSTEHAFQAAKTLDPSKRMTFTVNVPPRTAKIMGRRLPLREDWEEVKNEVMYELLRTKFQRGTDLAQRLLSTGDAELIEGNWWNDTYWGVCRGEGENHLGKLLMKVRQELRHESN